MPLRCFLLVLFYVYVLHDDVIKWKQFPRYWPFVRGIHRSPVNSPHKGQWRGALMFSLICVWINGWVNNREASDLRRYRAHYDVIVLKAWTVFIIHGMYCSYFFGCTVWSFHIHSGDGRLPVKSREVSKPGDSAVDFSNRSEIWQAPRRQRCRDACQISERYYHYNTQSRGFGTSWDLALRRPSA